MARPGRGGALAMAGPRVQLKFRPTRGLPASVEPARPGPLSGIIKRPGPPAPSARSTRPVGPAEAALPPLAPAGPAMDARTRLGARAASPPACHSDAPRPPQQPASRCHTDGAAQPALASPWHMRRPRYRHWHSDLSQAGRLSALLPVATLASAALSGPQRQAQS